jgi:hypothetical protein
LPSIENLKKRAKGLVRQHRGGHHPVAARLRRGLPRFAGLADREILGASFALSDAFEVIAHELGFASWALAAKELRRMPHPTADHPQRKPRLLAAYPQLFVSDVRRAADFYVGTLGFSIVYLYGEPPFYGQVARDGIGLNLRHVDAPVIDQALREKESLLGAAIVVEGVKELFLGFERAGAAFAQRLKPQPWARPTSSSATPTAT